MEEMDINIELWGKKDNKHGYIIFYMIFFLELQPSPIEPNELEFSGFFFFF